MIYPAVQLLAGLFGAGKAIRSTLDGSGAAKAIDTATNALKGLGKADTAVLSVRYVEAMMPSRIARRWVAIRVTQLWTWALISYVAYTLMSPWLPDAYAAKVDASRDALFLGLEVTTGAMMLVLAFYFAAPHIEHFAKAALTKMKGSK